MRQSLLNFAWSALERRLTADRADAAAREQFKLCDAFLRDLDAWQPAGSQSEQSTLALRAARLSLALADDARPLSEDETAVKFAEGLAAWRDVASREPSQAVWRRAQCLHVLTYAERTADDPARVDWLFWRHDHVAAIGPLRETMEPLEADYAMLLGELAARREGEGRLAEAAGMYRAANEILEPLCLTAQPAVKERTMLLDIQLGLLHCSRLLENREEKSAVLARTDRLLRQLPPADECPPELAWAAGELMASDEYLKYRSSLGDDANAMLAEALQRLNRDGAFSQANADRTLKLALLQRQLGTDKLRGGDVEGGLQMLDQAVSTLLHEKWLAHRDVVLLRGRIHFAVADLYQAQGNLDAALLRVSLGLSDFQRVELRRRDPFVLWLAAIDAWHKRADLCFQMGRNEECRQSVDACRELIERLGPQRRGRDLVLAIESEVERLDGRLAKLELEGAVGRDENSSPATLPAS